MDYSKLLGFDVVSNEIVNGIDFRNETVGATLGAKVGTKIPLAIDLPLEVGEAGAPIMRVLGGRKIASST
jgi:hypothetical protein